MMFRSVLYTLCFGIMFLVCFIKDCTTTTTASKCEGIRHNGCCIGYIWNPIKGNCTKCILGYSGPNCTIKCPYPTFGDGCQGYCDCNNDTCDFSMGCVVLQKEENSTSEAKGSINGILKHLIQIFGGVDIILICLYSIVFIIDRQRQQNTLQIENETIHVSENNLLCDDIEIIVSPDW